MAIVGINAHLWSRASTYRAAGVSRHIASLVAALGRIGPPERLEIFVGPGGSAPGFRVSRLPTERPAARILWEQTIAPVEIVRRRLDLFHAPAYVAPLAAACPTVVTVHDLSFFRLPHLFRPGNRTYLQVMTRLSLRRARRVIAVSESTKQEVVSILGVPPERIAVVPNGVEPFFQPLPSAEVERFRRDKGLPDQFVLHLGTLEPRKNVDTLVRAFARLKKRGLPHKLVLAGGKGWLYDAIFAEVEALGLRDEVLFAGFVPFADQPLWYNAAAALAYPALYEGFGLPPLESMACGTPVVTSNSSSLPEVVGDAGLQVDPKDENALAEAIGRALEDGALRERMREAGLARARRFDWDDVARRTLSVYRDALA